MESLSRDVSFAVRSLAKNPSFTAIVVLTLGLGIGANTAIFTLFDQVLLRMLPVREPQRLVLLDGPGTFMGRTMNDRTFSYPMYRDLRERTGEVFSGVVARFPAAVTLTIGQQSERASVELVSGNYFEVLGVPAAIGRTLTAADDEKPLGHPVVMLSHGFWARRFGADPGVVGRTLEVNGHSMTVVGVAPRGFTGLEVGGSYDLFTPLTNKAWMTPTWDDLQNRRSRWVNVMARLRPGIDPEQARAGANVAYSAILKEELASTYSDAGDRFRSRFAAKKLEFLPGLRGQSELRDRFQTPLVVLLGMVGVVLLIACANVANLLLARGASRQRELTIRLALGAGRGRVVRQLLVESLLLAFAGGGAGLLLSQWTGELLIRALPFEDARQVLSASPDLRVAGFAFVLSLLTGVLFGLAPALRATRPDLVHVLKEQAAGAGGGAHLRFRKGLVVAQVALSLLLLVGAGLFTRSLVNLRALDPGFSSEGLTTFSVDPTLSGYDPQRTLQFYARLRESLAAVPDVRQASMAVLGVMTGNDWRATVRVDGYKPKEDEDMNPSFNAVGPDYFAALGVRLLAGREFGEQDAAKAPRVAIVNEAFARYYYGEQSPLGRRFGFGRDQATDVEIVGLVKDGKSSSLRDETPRFVYVPYTQAGELDSMVVYVRSSRADAAITQAIRDVVRRADASLPVYDMKTLETQISESLFVERMIAALSAAFGLLATVLAALGLYGVMSYSVTRRTREIGIRMALGAERRDVVGMVMSEVALLAGVGIGMGLPTAWAGARLLSAQLYGLSPTDPTTLAAATATLAAVALLAGLVPARRATAVDPVHALHYE